MSPVPIFKTLNYEYKKTGEKMTKKISIDFK